MRAFLALNLEVASIRQVAELGKQLRGRARAPEASWIAATKLHITLKFFGAIDVGLTPAIVDAVKPLADAEVAPRVRFAKVTGFPDEETARVLVLEMDDRSGDLTRLFVEVERRVDAIGFPREERPYRPHVTLARFRAPTDIRAFSEAVGRPKLDEALVTELVLYRSDLSSAGAEYVPLMRSGFGGV
ncbi:MAG: RNA 2',3'-cyclic phosphodiesterase, partial [Polyangiaceae bacterium]